MEMTMHEQRGVPTKFLTQEQLGSVSTTWATDKAIAKAELIVARNVYESLLNKAINGNVSVNHLVAALKECE